jgi:predicted esterase
MHLLKKNWWLILLGILLAAMIGFVAWGLIIPIPMPEAIASLQSDDQVNITTKPWLVFQPTQYVPTTGFIIYPGGRVDPRAYAPQAHAIAAKGYLVVIVPMPLNLAVLGTERASSVIKDWVIGGHSLGGSMAASYAYHHKDKIKGLVLWASYPASNNDLSDSTLKVTSIYATLDGLATQDKIGASHNLLPADTTWVQIVGGNHAQFGWYGAQSGDNPAVISREEQQAQVIQSTLDLLFSVRNSP